MSQHVSVSLELPIDREEFCRLAQKDPYSAGEMLAQEISEFDAWIVQLGMEPLTRLERQIVKEYIGFKLTRAC